MFGLRCKACASKDAEIAELHQQVAVLQEKMHISRAAAAHYQRQVGLLRLEQPSVWHKFFSKEARRPDRSPLKSVGGSK